MPRTRITHTDPTGSRMTNGLTKIAVLFSSQCLLWYDICRIPSYFKPARCIPCAARFWLRLIISCLKEVGTVNLQGNAEGNCNSRSPRSTRCFSHGNGEFVNNKFQSVKLILFVSSTIPRSFAKTRHRSLQRVAPVVLNSTARETKMGSIRLSMACSR